ncbi:MAG: erythromycin esterase family protein [Bacillus sp. (in: Bacteria)]|nr:erythromycin esterase family protein [Bacillus sp. (in: firmicutes)]
MIQTINLQQSIESHSVAFKDVEDLRPLLEEASKAKYILLGESTHGTSEFYSLRAEISKWLIQEKGYDFLAVEGDWPACYEVNRYIKGYEHTYKNAKDALHAFNRWPQWMWYNQEVQSLVEWLRSYNEKGDWKTKIGFYGIDVYSLWESMERIIDYLEEINSPDATEARQAFACFEPFHREPQMYGVSSAFYGKSCWEELSAMLKAIHENRELYPDEVEASLNLKLNSLVMKNGEHYYHTMVTNDSESWNIRDQHMVEALENISQFYGPDAKGIIWEHNTHIGDARATDMADEGMVNVGQITREKYGAENVYAIGLGTYEGTVIAGEKWGEPAKIMEVPKGGAGSWEALMHETGAYNKYMMFTEANKELFTDTLGHRAIGVVYDPRREHLGNYVPSRMSARYDAYIHIDNTKALTPL